ncbi:LysR family transcriptional regulator [Bradyrhizobium sp. Ce-3]|uniref:LysR family transcriptional regulator n=1 Tax=Bradyrhizobium sp. Ce-3 TaxID=2913970 RepID=UPI001FC8CD90|nr:LysR family transcriptional regulator [Bradyrhizobium sp. Ce-3]GKQ55358.1 LysR family transcriptional regulator [Bradyrhizobium sp. Ce-3]
MLDDITELRTFVKIVATGSLSAAGREMGIALSVVSKRLATLERRTDTSLIVRSTRHLALTEEGQRLFDRAQRILAEVDEAEAALAHGRVEPQGVLRVSATVAFGRAHVSPVCRDLALTHPKMSVELMLTDRLVELIDERIDVVIRIGMPRDSDLIMRKLIDNHRIIAASPGYVMRHGAPASPADLTQHNCLLYNRGAEARWRLAHGDGRIAEIDVSSRLRCDNGEVAHDWAVDGAGLIMKSWVDVAPDLASGRLVQVLPDWRSDPAPVCALFAQGRQMPTRVRLFLDAISKRMAAFQAAGGA